MRYIRPKSLTWWTGILCIALGVVQAAGWPLAWDGAQWATGVLGAFRDALTALLGGDGSPAALIGLGFGLIGVRDALARVYEDPEDWGGIVGLPNPWDELLEADEPEQDPDLPPGVIDPYGPGGSRE